MVSRKNIKNAFKLAVIKPVDELICISYTALLTLEITQAIKQCTFLSNEKSSNSCDSINSDDKMKKNKNNECLTVPRLSYTQAHLVLLAHWLCVAKSEEVWRGLITTEDECREARDPLKMERPLIVEEGCSVNAKTKTETLVCQSITFIVGLLQE